MFSFTLPQTSSRSCSILMEVENPPWKKEVLLRPCQRSPGQGRRGSAVAVLITGCTHDANQFQFQFLDDKLQRVLLLSHFYKQWKTSQWKAKAPYHQVWWLDVNLRNIDTDEKLRHRCQTGFPHSSRFDRRDVSKLIPDSTLTIFIY